MLNRFVFVSSFLFSLPLLASPLEKLKCSKEIKALAKEWKATEEWMKHYQGGLSSSFLASPTDKVGKWVLVMETPKGSVISKIEEDGRIEVSFEGEKCVKVVKPYPSASIKSIYKNDQDIERFVVKNKTGAFYVWSPRMGLSQKGITEFKTAAKKLKVPVLVLMDKSVSDQELKKLKTELGEVDTERVDSLEFKMRNIGQHFPAIMAFKNSKILPEVKYGFETSDRYELDLLRLLGRGK